MREQGRIAVAAVGDEQSPLLVAAEDLEVLQRLSELDVVAGTQEPLRSSCGSPGVGAPDAEVG